MVFKNNLKYSFFCDSYAFKYAIILFKAPVLSGFVRATTSSSNYSDSKYEVATSLSSSSDELHTSASTSDMNSNIPTKVSSETSSTAVDRNPIINDDFEIFHFISRVM